jgi:hypothetical protein
MPRLIAAVVLLVTAAPALAEDYPHVVLKNDKLKVKVYLPDPEKGFYRGTRFDRAGVLGEIGFAGHTIFGPWKDTHDPTNHDDILGPVEEFGMEKPLGYDEAKVGGTFLKFGVGELEKPKEEKYNFAGKYKVVKPAEWTRTDKREPVELKAGIKPEQMIGWAMEQEANGYSYQYTKVLAVGGDTLVILHHLKNTGEKPITTDFYNHNFFNVDADPVGPNYSFAFSFEVGTKDLRGKFGELVEAKGKELRFKDKLSDGFVMAGLTGFDPKRGHNTFEMRHAPSKVSVEVGFGYPLAKFNVWGIKTTICPEPFMQIENLQPGQEKVWMVNYTFKQEPAKK